MWVSASADLAHTWWQPEAVIGRHNTPLPGASSNAPGVRSRTFVGGPQGGGEYKKKRGEYYNIFLTIMSIYKCTPAWKLHDSGSRRFHCDSDNKSSTPTPVDVTSRSSVTSCVSYGSVAESKSVTFRAKRRRKQREKCGWRRFWRGMVLPGLRLEAVNKRRFRWTLG